MEKRSKISCHYRFIGELPTTMAEVLREIKPYGAVQKELSAENERLTKEPALANRE